MDHALRCVDRVSYGLAVIGCLQMLLLIGAMVFEVAARYGFNSPTVWSSDISFMLNGTMILIGSAITLRMNAHIRVDILSDRFPYRVQNALGFVFFLFLFVPVMVFLLDVCIDKTLRAFARNERELSSAWGPLVWPFYLGITLGIAGLTLQSTATAVRYGRAFLRNQPVDSATD